MNPINTVFDAKRLIGRKFSDAPVQSDIKLWPFKVKSGPAEKPMIVVDFKGESKEFAAEEISSMVLIKMCVARAVHARAGTRACARKALPRVPQPLFPAAFGADQLRAPALLTPAGRRSLRRSWARP
jgi:hypothetical protein